MKGGGAAQARKDMLEQLGVKAQYVEFAPANLDPRKAEDKAALEKWAADRPEIRTGTVGPAPAPTPMKLLDKTNNPFAASPFYRPDHIAKNALANNIKV